VPYAATGILAILALGLPPRSGLRAASVALCGAVFLAGAGIAVYHVGVEQHWWASTAACAGALPAEMTVEALRAQLAVRPPKPCDQVDWTLFGISFAGYNLMASLALAAFSLAGARRLMGAS
jgi:disulfide bond formation protein DsbB